MISCFEKRTNKEDNMGYSKVYRKQNASSPWSSIANSLAKGWETIIGPSNARCKAYCNQAEVAQEKMQNDKLSRRERKFWSKQNDKAMDGLADVHRSNSDTFVKAICAVGAGFLIGKKLLGK